MARNERNLEAIVLDEGLTITLTELTRLCGSRGRTIELMVSEGVLHPRAGQAPADWRFDGLAVRRARRALRLRRDLALNLAGTALALELLDELESLRGRVQTLEHQLSTFEAHEL